MSVCDCGATPWSHLWQGQGRVRERGEPRGAAPSPVGEAGSASVEVGGGDGVITELRHSAWEHGVRKQTSDGRASAHLPPPWRSTGRRARAVWTSPNGFRTRGNCFPVKTSHLQLMMNHTDSRGAQWLGISVPHQASPRQPSAAGRHSD